MTISALIDHSGILRINFTSIFYSQYDCIASQYDFIHVWYGFFNTFTTSYLTGLFYFLAAKHEVRRLVQYPMHSVPGCRQGDFKVYSILIFISKHCITLFKRVIRHVNYKLYIWIINQLTKWIVFNLVFTIRTHSFWLYKEQTETRLQKRNKSMNLTEFLCFHFLRTQVEGDFIPGGGKLLFSIVLIYHFR